MGGFFSKPVPKPPEPTLPRSPSRTVKCESPGDSGRVKPKRNSAECRAFRKCFSVLADGITDPGRLAVQLYSRELIGPDIRREAQKPAIAERVKIVNILSAVEDQIVASPTTKFREFLDVLQDESSLQHLATRLENTYCELEGVSIAQTTEESRVKATDACDVSVLSSELETVVDWHKLGLNLGLPKHELDKIECDYQGNDRQRLEMLDKWLRRVPNAAWEDVVSALEQMGENRLAETIHQKSIRGGGKINICKEQHCPQYSKFVMYYLHLVLWAASNWHETRYVIQNMWLNIHTLMTFQSSHSFTYSPPDPPIF